MLFYLLYNTIYVHNNMSMFMSIYIHINVNYAKYTRQYTNHIYICINL